MTVPLDLNYLVMRVYIYIYNIICNYQNVNIFFYSMIVSEHVQHVHMYKEVSVALTVMYLPVLHQFVILSPAVYGDISNFRPTIV